MTAVILSTSSMHQFIPQQKRVPTEIFSHQHDRINVPTDYFEDRSFDF
jgi:hypothetical protein